MPVNGPAATGSFEIHKRVFIAFEGGGAKGIQHVGALRALEKPEPDIPDKLGQPRISIEGVSGTSAGAIVAALVAAGYRSSDMVDAEGGSPLLRRVCLSTATDLFGASEWRALFIIRGLFSNLGAVAPLLASVIIGWGISFWASTTAGFVVTGLIVAAGWISARRAIRGIISLSPLIKNLNRVLHQKLSESRSPGDPPIEDIVRFKHFTKTPLRIVTTNVDRQRLALFSEKTTPEAPVAEVVAASIALPFVFRPVWMRTTRDLIDQDESEPIEHDRHCDGGLVSNLPAWVFDEECEIDPDILTLAFEIEDSTRRIETLESPDGKPIKRLVPIEHKRGLPYLVRLMRSAVFGGGALSKRTRTSLESISLGTEKIDILDFDATRADVLQTVKDAAKRAAIRLDEALFQFPWQFEQACKTIHDSLAEMIDKVAAEHGSKATTATIRVNISQPDPGTTKTLRIFAHWNMCIDGAADDDMILPIDKSIPGQAYINGTPLMYSQQFPPHVNFQLSNDRKRAAAAWKKMEWVLSIPIYLSESEVPVGVLTIDADQPPDKFGLTLNKATLNAFSDSAVQILRPIFEAYHGQTSNNATS